MVFDDSYVTWNKAGFLEYDWTDFCLGQAFVRMFLK